MPRRAVLGILLASLGVGVTIGAQRLGVFGPMEENTFLFVRGTQMANGERLRLENWILDSLNAPHIGYRIIGHSGTTGDPEANRTLSQNRAEHAAQILRDLGVPSQRLLTVVGVAGSRPTVRGRDMSEREHERLNARVEIQKVLMP